MAQPEYHRCMEFVQFKTTAISSKKQNTQYVDIWQTLRSDTKQLLHEHYIVSAFFVENFTRDISKKPMSSEYIVLDLFKGVRCLV